MDQRSHQLVEADSGQAAFRGDQATRETLDQTDRDLGTLETHPFQGFAIDFEEFRRAHRDRARASRFPEHDAHLAEELARPQLGDDATTACTAAADLDMAGLDYVEIDALVAFIEDDLSVFVATLEGVLDLDLRRLVGAQNESPVCPATIACPACWRFRPQSGST